MTDVCTHEHTMTRIDLVTGIDYDKFVTEFEKAAPQFDPEPVLRIAAENGNWDDILTAVARNAPKDLMVYAKIDAAPLLNGPQARGRRLGDDPRSGDDGLPR